MILRKRLQSILPKGFYTHKPNAFSRFGGSLNQNLQIVGGTFFHGFKLENSNMAGLNQLELQISTFHQVIASSSDQRLGLKSCCWNQVAYHRTPLQTQSLGIKELPLQSSGGSLTHWWQTHELNRDLVYTIHVSLEHPNTDTWGWHLIGMTILPHTSGGSATQNLTRYVEA